MHENTSVVVRNYSLGYMETLSRIHGVFYRMHENPQSIHGDTYRSLKFYSFERTKIYLNLRNRMYKILDWIYKIPAWIYESIRSNTWRYFCWMHKNSQLTIWKCLLEYVKLPVRIPGNTPSNVRSYVFKCPKVLTWLYETSNIWNILMNIWHCPPGYEKFRRIHGSIVSGAWDHITEHMKVLTWIRGNTHSGIWNNRLDILEYVIECIKITRSNR